MSMFRGPSTPTPQPLPADPAIAAQAEQDRVDAANAAVAASKGTGRASTIVAGMRIAADDQEQRGLLAQKKRGAAADLVGQ